MKNAQKKQISEMRNDGFGYTSIAAKMGLTKDCVRAYCRTHNLTGKRALTTTRVVTDKDYCKTCGERLTHTPGKRKKQFCSAGCRMDWWNAHADKVNRKAYYTLTCSYCGKEFTVYGNAKRKYCSHECYIKDRFSHDNDS